jgi:hypothetical protein
MISRERLAEIRALTWEWNYEDCSDHQSAVDDLLAELDAKDGEIAELKYQLDCFRRGLQAALTAWREAQS